MKLVAITHPEYLPNEAELLCRLFESGLAYLHLRKPQSSKTSFIKLIEDIPTYWHSKIVLHDYYELCHRYDLGGIHLNRRNSSHINDCKVFSCSCHSLKEVEYYRSKVEKYLFLSPIFDSVSKQGYTSNFTIGQLLEAKERGAIAEDIIALGGITSSNINVISRLGFGGAAVLGSLWGDYLIDRNQESVLSRFEVLKQKITE